MSGIEIACVVPSHSELGEGAVWDDRESVLWWVDIAAGLIHRFDPVSGQNATNDFGQPVGSLALREAGGMVLATKSGFWLFDWYSGTRIPLDDPESDMPGNRFNDGTTDARGRFWAGTMQDRANRGRHGAFYRLDPDFTAFKWRDEYIAPNGLAFSPDGRTMYFSDSDPSVRTIWKCDYDLDSGIPGDPQAFFDTRAVAGRPDGGTVDADGCYWQAGVSGWQIYRITPGGQVDMTIDMPVEKPTKPMFGGPNLDVLYVTSIGAGVDPTAQPEAGGLFAVTGLGVQGVPQWRFAG